MYLSVVEKLYGMDEEIDIMKKLDKTFGNRENICLFAKINDKELANKIKNDRIYFKYTIWKFYQ